MVMEKLAHPGDSGGCTPTSFHYIYLHIQSCGVALAERADILPLFLLYLYMYSRDYTTRQSQLTDLHSICEQKKMHCRYAKQKKKSVSKEF
jgi:hypothetical protein